jgi:hypothetical protein
MSLPTDDKARKALPIFTYITEYFPDSLIEECRVAVIGNDQHNPGEPLHWARDKSTDQMNTAFRHMFDHKRGVVKDKDGAYHLAKAIWRLKAELQLQIERDRAAAALSARADNQALAHLQHSPGTAGPGAAGSAAASEFG